MFETIYRLAPEVKTIADPLIEQFHSHLQLPGVRIVYLMRSDHYEKKGADGTGEARKVSGLAAFSFFLSPELQRQETEEEAEHQRECIAAEEEAEKRREEFREKGDEKRARLVTVNYPDRTKVNGFFVITMTGGYWCNLTPSQRVALTDHELEHCFAEREFNEDKRVWETKLSIRPHDLEEFDSIVRRHGKWKSNIRSFIDEASSYQTRLELVGNDPMEATG